MTVSDTKPEIPTDANDEYLLGLVNRNGTTTTISSTASLADYASLANSIPHSAVRPKEKEFYWSSEQHMHIARNRAMLAKYPQIKKLMGYDPWTKWPCIGIVLLQAIIGLGFAHRMSWGMFFFVAYTVGATCNGALFLANHEVTHYLAFEKKAYNDLFAMLVINFPIVIPFSMMFKSYHADHHRYLGWEDIDPDLPTAFEAKCLSNFFGKLFFLTFQVLFYCIRPMFVTFVPFKWQHTLNYIVMLGGHAYLALGLGYYWATAYWICSGFFAGSLHPLAGHFLAEHYIFRSDKEDKKKDSKPRGGEVPKEALYAPQETFSYYGILNFFSFNAGYHVEHHDFPNIPYTKVKELRKIAPEFYDHLETVDSWAMLLWKFMTTKNVSSYARVKREKGAGIRRKGKLLPTTECTGIVM